MAKEFSVKKVLAVLLRTFFVRELGGNVLKYLFRLVQEVCRLHFWKNKFRTSYDEEERLR